MNDLSLNERHIFSAEILIHLLVLYKAQTEGKKFKLDMTRSFLKFLPDLKFVEAIGDQAITASSIREVLSTKSHACVFNYVNQACCECGPEELIDLMCEFWDIIRHEESSFWVNIPVLALIYLVNMKPEFHVYDNLRLLITTSGSQWSNPIFQKIRSANNYEEFVELRGAMMEDRELLSNSVLWHQVKVIDQSNLEATIKDSEIDYEIKEKIMLGRRKAANIIGAWWKTRKRKPKANDEALIIEENRMAKCLHRDVKYLPSDDRLLVRSS